MNRSPVLIVIAGSVCLFVSVAATAWFIVVPHEARRAAAKSAPFAQRFDMTGGQYMQPRWNKQEGEGNGASQN